MPKKIVFCTLISLILSPIFLLSPAQAKSCVATPAGTEGPYYLADMPVRRDITEGQKGISTKLQLKIVDSNCKAVKGALVDIWHTTASGTYSGVDGNDGIYLRGSQVSNSKGIVVFNTIFPGWYPQRTMHIHFKVWKNGSEVLTSQLFVSDLLTTKIYGMSPYNSRGNQAINNARDGIYQGYGASVKLVTLNVKVNPSKINANAQIVIPSN